MTEQQLSLWQRNDRRSTSGCFPAPNSATCPCEGRDGRASLRPPDTTRLSDGSSEGIFSTLGIDLGSRVTGFALHNPRESRVTAWGRMDHENMGWNCRTVPDRMENRARLRRTRRTRKWYRPKRFDNRARGEVSHGEWLAPTMRSHLAAHLKLIRFLLDRHDVDLIRVEVARFDPHKIKLGRQPTDAEYQQGPTYGYENRKQFVLDRDRHTCQYCGAEEVPLEVDHILPQSRWPNLRYAVENMATACVECNRDKGQQTAEEYGCPGVQEQVEKRSKQFLRDATRMNLLSTVLIDWLERGRLYVEEEEQEDRERGSWEAVQKTWGHITKRDRKDIGWPKTHRHDAAAIATGGENSILPKKHLVMRWVGRPSRQKYEADMKANGRLKPLRKRTEITVDGTTFRHGDYVEYRGGRGEPKRGFVKSLQKGPKLGVTNVDGTDTWARSAKNFVKLANAPRLRYELREAS